MLPVLSLLAALTAGPARVSVIIVGSVDGGVASDRPVHARKGQVVRLYALVLQGRRWFGDAPRVRLRGRRLPRRRLRPLSALGSAVRVRWSQIEPRPHHFDLAPPNEGNPAYSNAVLFGPRHGRWLGYDLIEVVERPIPSAFDPVLTLRRVRPAHPRVNVHDGLGVMHYRVQLEVDGQRLASRGEAPVVKRGISPRIMRVAFRATDDWVGHLTSYFNVPNVFGSGGSGRTHQAELYQGADCADVIIAAARRAGAPLPYTSVAGLSRHARPVSEALLLTQDGVFEIDEATRKPTGRATLSFGGDIRRGDIMLIDYLGFAGSPRSWDHVAVVTRDAGRIGRFDPADRVMHMGYLYGLTETAAHTEGPAVVRFLRFKRAIRRAFSRRRHSR